MLRLVSRTRAALPFDSVMRSWFSIVAAALACALLTASTVGAFNDVDDELDGDDLVDVYDMAASDGAVAATEYSPAFTVLHAWSLPRSTGRDVVSSIFRPPIS
jgi:predicted ribosomally synthesized peptide with SipW-like signal peptide